jgi:hypothetical protein
LEPTSMAAIRSRLAGWVPVRDAGRALTRP